MQRQARKQRRFPRYEVAGVHGHFVVPARVEVVNLSLGGMALETHEHLEFGREYRLEVDNEGGPLALVGTVVWCNLLRTARAGGDVLPVYRAGIKFQAISGHKVRDLMEYLKDHAEVSLEDSFAQRYPMTSLREVDLATNYRLDVRKLSLGGMLVETELRPDRDDEFDLELRLNGWRWQARGRVASIPRRGEPHRRELTQLGIEFREFGEKGRSTLASYITNYLQ